LDLRRRSGGERRPQTIMLALTAVVVSCALMALAERPKRAGRMA
jgi:hypothetical protein